LFISVVYYCFVCIFHSRSITASATTATDDSVIVGDASWPLSNHDSFNSRETSSAFPETIPFVLPEIDTNGIVLMNTAAQKLYSTSSSFDSHNFNFNPSVNVPIVIDNENFLYMFQCGGDSSSSGSSRSDTVVFVRSMFEDGSLRWIKRIVIAGR